MEPTDKDYELGAQHLDAELRVRALMYQARVAHAEHVKPLEAQLRTAIATLDRLTVKYDAMMTRLGDEDQEAD